MLLPSLPTGVVGETVIVDAETVNTEEDETGTKVPVDDGGIELPASSLTSMEDRGGAEEETVLPSDDETLGSADEEIALDNWLATFAEAAVDEETAADTLVTGFDKSMLERVLMVMTTEGVIGAPVLEDIWELSGAIVLAPEAETARAVPLDAMAVTLGLLEWSIDEAKDDCLLPLLTALLPLLLVDKTVDLNIEVESVHVLEDECTGGIWTE